MATLKVMKYHYIRRERRWIREENIPKGKHYEGYKSPYPIDPLMVFDERDYLDYSFLFPHGDDGDDEVQQDHEAPPPPRSSISLSCSLHLILHTSALLLLWTCLL
ncbi:hypothetical protein Scep_016377 [Stephania cephalantha]|uniref:Uncharacterized protein n=1 Tax=Stephania cephalantha TaxID=152367 RepID=A0AAP0NU45_9MAGN